VGEQEGERRGRRENDGKGTAWDGNEAQENGNALTMRKLVEYTSKLRGEEKG
jgi:hypothetical protein